MVYFLNLDGTMTLAEPQRVFQGSNNVNTVYVLSAIAPPTALEISFTLPSGLTTAYYPMIYNGPTDEYTVPNTTTTVYLRSFLLTSNITAEVGTVGVSINAVYSNADGTTGNQTSFTGSFNVEYSSIPETVTTGTADELQQALDLLSQYYTQQQAIITGGTNGEYLQSQGNNQLPVWTSFDMDFVTANREQSFSEEQQAQARENINAQETIKLAPNLAVVSNADGTLTTAEATTEEVNFLSGVTSNLQTQINGKQATLTFDNTPTSGSDNPVTSDGINAFVGEQINENCVLFSGAQSLTAEQQLQARKNIGAEGSSNTQYFVSVLPQSFTTEQQAQATANINACSTNGTYPNLTAGTAQNSNNNLVLNGDFLLNTNGQTVYNSGTPYGKETANGWIMVDASNRTGSVEVLNGGGVKLTATSNGFGFRQAFDFTGAGKTYTLTCKISAVNGNTTPLLVFLRNTDYSANYGTINNGISEVGVFSRTYYIPDSANVPLQVYIAVESTSTFTNTCEYTIDYLKLEEGSVSTAPNNLVTNATNALFADTATNATNDGNGNSIVDTYATQNGTYPNMTAGNSEKSNALNRTYYSDLNNATKGGTLFYGDTLSSQNTASISAFAGQVFQGGTGASLDYLAQKAIHYGGVIAGVDSTVTREYVRGKFGSSWQNWQEIPSIVEDWQSSDGLSWYRIWSNGLKECGGTLTTNPNSTAKSVALPVTYANTDYQILITPKNLNNTASPVVIKIINNSITTTSFNVVGCYATASSQDYNATLFNYYCRGY